MKSNRDLNGYRVVYLPDHPAAMSCENWKGYVYEHIEVATRFLGRALRDDEVVHHLDGDRANNLNTNLLVLNRSQHMKLHQWLEAGAPYGKPDGKQGKNSGKPKLNPLCTVCGRTLQGKQRKTCSLKCDRVLRQAGSTKPSKEELMDQSRTLSREAIGRIYGVTGNAVRKWMIGYGMAIPSRARSTLLEGVETSGGVKSP